MQTTKDTLKSSRHNFGEDPFGYCVLARHKLGLASTIAGFPVDITKPATENELKNPVLWLTQAHALSEAAIAVLEKDPAFGVIPSSIRDVCDSQYCAVGLMLVGYSLEICLKSMMIMREGIDGYKAIEKKNRHHRLHQLASFIPELSEKDLAILKGLTHFVYWAGRYPDPGSGREDDVEDIFNISEEYQISAKDIFTLLTKVMQYSLCIAEKT
ncbi:hypothetical protein H2Y57_12680 [Pectobacterium aroidearum]|uniref:HEPN domain-containing protein n=1 Tax=Pectobacterium aroidearum TaxID=1201031 RepID=A0AAW3SVD5_9GAMM|nr:hypothetical protein [Pectobacterium aroidearum]MBA5204531.1 hypothetical protein [Pectobacterium aroidearum]